MFSDIYMHTQLEELLLLCCESAEEVLQAVEEAAGRVRVVVERRAKLEVDIYVCIYIVSERERKRETHIYLCIYLYK